jgi:hypothetical protein
VRAEAVSFGWAVALGGLGVLQCSVVLAIKGSKTASTEGRMKMLTKAEMTAPRESIMQISFTMSMVDTAATPMVAQKKTSAEVRMEISEELAAS